MTMRTVLTALALSSTILFFGVPGVASLAYGASDSSDSSESSDLVCLEAAKRGDRQYAYARANLPEILTDRIGKGELLEKPCTRATLLSSIAGMEQTVAAPECNPPNAQRAAFCQGSSALKSLLDAALAELDAEAGE